MKDFWQKLLDSTDLDEKIKEQVSTLDDKAKAGIEKYISDKVRRKALIIGAALGGVIGFALGQIFSRIF